MSSSPIAIPVPLTRVAGADQLRTAERGASATTLEEPASDPAVDDPEELAEPPSEPPPPQPVRTIPKKNAAVHAFDILMTRFISFLHQFVVDFVKFYKIWTTYDANSVIFRE
ncbi:hypothetical protein C7H08_12045 [Marinobacter halophilus]|uniref:Uncharacterized protein n=1 Tax=Marinobacter halophilus TaxID=1323740 RepID=A0A2T1KBW2_9GAMM|nr:hypothetical protein C7H08_12045 [Marinobacter halophilus]